MFSFTLRPLVWWLACSAAFAATDLDRELVLAPHAGTGSDDVEIGRWQERARRDDATPEVYERLAWSYVAKARRTLDGGFYKLAEKTADVLEARFGPRAESRLLRGHVLHQLHHFQAAESLARSLVAMRGSPADLALLSDVLIERGALAEGTKVLQQLVEAKPGVEAYSRIAHVRWLKGDPAGAIAAMETAVTSGTARDVETRAWLLTRLAGFHLQGGRAEWSLRLAEAALASLPEFPPALLASGRASLALQRTDAALAALTRAEALQPMPEYQWWLADALALAGRGAEAAAVERRLVARGAENDPRTLALFLATRGVDLARSVRLARAELAERGDPLSHDALAWALAASGEIAEASVAAQQARSSGTVDARILLHAGEIARHRGDLAEARDLFARATAVQATLTPSEAARLARSQAEVAAFAAR